MGLFDDLDNKYEKEWKDMPEFVQENNMPYKSITIHFRNSDDIKQFAKLLDQKITRKTKSLWYPKAELNELIKMRYIDES